MTKITFISLIASAIIFIGAIMADGVVIDHNLPQTLQPGEKTIVSVSINKGEVTGFAKLQLEIPAGLTARAIKKSGASFTFSGQKAKFIWMTLPDQQEFSIEYELEANPNSSGSKVITGQFSYIKANERVDHDLAPKVIAIGEDMVDTSDSQTNNTNSPQTGNASCTRTLTKISEGEYFVEITAESVNSDGFAKIIENISGPFAIEEDNSGESIVTVETDQIKFVWFEKPSDESFTVSYRLVAANDDDKPEITGNFAYVEDNTPKEILIIHQDMINPKDFGDAVVDNSDDSNSSSSADSSVDNNDNSSEIDTAADMADVTDTTNTDSQDQNSSVADKPDNQDSSSIADNSYEDPDLDVSASTVPDPEVGVTYKIQLSATHKYITANNFKKQQKISQTIQTENHEGWTKFVTGSHDIYKDARDSRNQIRSAYPKLKGPFVTAYNDGQRITVQEALMISKQKWYQ